MKTTLTLAALLVSGAAAAHSDHNSGNISVSSQSCDLTFQNTLRISPERVEFSAGNNQSMIIDQDGSVTLDGKSVALSSSQQNDMKDYADNVRSQVPQVAEIAMEGVKLAGVALDEVGSAFGIDNMQGMQSLMEDVATEIQDSFYQGGTFVMDQGNFENLDHTFGPEFDAKIEEAMEEMVMESIGSLLITLGTELLSSGGNMNEFEQRMENMGKQIEEKVELQAANLEQRADGLCHSFTALALQEDAIQQFMPEFKNYDVFVVKSK